MAFFLQHAGDFSTQFSSQSDLAWWGLTVAGSDESHIELYENDADHPACARMWSDDINLDIIKPCDVVGGIKYMLEFAYKGELDGAWSVTLYDATNSASLWTKTLDLPIWSNVYHEKTLPSTCEQVWIIFKRTGATNTSLFVDDLLFQGNAFLRDPEVPADLELVSESHDYISLNSDVRIDESLPTVRGRLEWVGLDHDSYIRLWQHCRQLADTWFDDGAVPSSVDEAILRTELTDDFTDTTNNIAWQDTSSSLPVNADDFETTEFSSGEYEAIDADDVNYAETIVSVTGEYGYHKFKIKILDTEFDAIDEIRRIKVTYKGESDDQGENNNDGIVLYAWDGSHWYKLGESRQNGIETILFESSNASISQSICTLEGSYIYIRLLARTRGTKNANGALSLKSYFVQVVINENMRTIVELSSKAVPAPDGSVIEVYNVTQATTLEVNTHYVLRDDRGAVVIFSGANEGDLIQVTYNHYYRVRTGMLSGGRLGGSSGTSPVRNVSLSIRGVEGVT